MKRAEVIILDENFVTRLSDHETINRLLIPGNSFVQTNTEFKRHDKVTPDSLRNEDCYTAKIYKYIQISHANYMFSKKES